MTAPRVGRTKERRPTRMISHWEPPGSYPGRPFYSWYFTFDSATDLRNLATDYAAALRSFPVDIVPPDGLHLTLQNVGHVDEVDAVTIRRIASTASSGCQHIAPFEVAIDRAIVHPEAVLLLVIPRDPIDHVREVIRQAIADVIGSSPPIDDTQADEAADNFVPHITVAYSRSNGAAAPLIDAVQSVDRKPVRVAIPAAHLLAVHRAGSVYRWSRVRTAGFKAPFPGEAFTDRASG